MSISELTQTISPAFTEKTIFDIINKKVSLTEIEILEILIDNGSSQKGDSYLSTICRFVVKGCGKNLDGRTETVSVPVIVKYFPKNATRQKTFRSADFFKAEFGFYEKVWPEMLKATKISEDLVEIPLYLAGHCDGKNDFIALEDLSYQGFNPCGRSEEITKEKLSVLLRTLANFHALGIVTRLKNPEFESIASGLVESYFADRHRPWYENFMYKSMGPQYQKTAKALLPQEYYEKITKLFSRDLYGDIIKCCSIRDKMCSVTQGDAWLPNFLTRDRDGEYKAIFIDFQLARYAPVTNDLLHFLYSCYPPQMLLEHWDDLVAEYHQYLSKRIEELGGDKNYISLNDINDEIQRYPLLGVGMSLETLLMSLLTDDEVTDLDTLKGDAVPLEEVWILPEFNGSRNEKLAFLVKHLVDKGFIP